MGGRVSSSGPGSAMGLLPEPRGDGAVEGTKGGQWSGEQEREVVPWESQAF